MLLDLRLSDLKDIPPSVFRMRELTALNLEMNRIAAIPDSIQELENLEELLLGYNDLTQINPAILELPKLKHLRLSRNRLTGTLPNVHFGAGDSLELDISHNALSQLQGFSGRPRLRALNAQFNQLHVLPRGLFANFDELDTLKISNNQLETLPRGLLVPGCLQVLHAPYNRLRQIDLAPDEVRKLRVLHLQGNALQRLPEGMEDLEELIAHENRLTRFHVEGSFEKLRLADLGFNQIESIGDQIVYCHNLLQLLLSGNRIVHLSSSVLRLRKLRQLSLSDNPLQSLSPRHEWTAEETRRSIEAPRVQLEASLRLLKEAERTMLGQFFNLKLL